MDSDLSLTQDKKSGGKEHNIDLLTHINASVWGGHGSLTLT